MAEAQQQLKNDTTKMAMKIPIFQGSSKDDTVDIMEFIRRFEASPEAMNLVDQLEKLENIFSSYLRFQELLLQIKTVNYLVVSDTRKRLADQTVRTVHW
jgi:hypothetical protein